MEELGAEHANRRRAADRIAHADAAARSLAGSWWGRCCSSRPTALSRTLAARADDGRTYTDDEAVLEVHHIVIAGFIVYALMAEAMRQLAEQPALRQRCLAEINERAPNGALTMAAVSKLQLSTNVILEAKRYVPLVPVAFGRAQRTFTCGGVTVPAGWTVYLALSRNNHDSAIYKDPHRFDPDRFGVEARASEAPDGIHPTRCRSADGTSVSGARLLDVFECCVPGGVSP